MNINKITILLISFLFLFSACNSQDLSDIKNNLNEIKDNNFNSHTNFEQREIGDDISTYFNQETKKYYRSIVNGSLECLEGDCPDKRFSKPMGKSDCFFCTNYSEVFDDKILIHTSSSNNGDFSGGCGTRSSFSLPGELKVVTKTKDYIELTGIGNGHVEQVGENCNTKFTFNYKTNERWIFTKNKLGDETKITVTTNVPDNKFSGHGWSNPTRGKSPVSESYFDVKCESELGFNLNPGFNIIAVNGYNISHGVTGKEEKLNDNKDHKRFRFGGFYNGIFTVQPKCTVFGSDVGEVVSDEIFNITISGEESTDFDISRYGY